MRTTNRTATAPATIRAALVATLAVAAVLVTGLVPAEAAARPSGSATPTAVAVLDTSTGGGSSATGRRGP